MARLGIGNVLIHNNRRVAQNGMILAYVTVKDDRFVCRLGEMD